MKRLLLIITLCMSFTVYAQEVADSFRAPITPWEYYTVYFHREFAKPYPYKGKIEYHTGVDTNVDATPTGTHIYAIGNGIVRYAGTAGSYGNYDGIGYVVIIEHTLMDGGHILSLYGHVQNGTYNETTESGLIPTGTVVKKGQYIAQVADYMQGTENWHHLHLGVMKGSYNEVGYSITVRGYENSPEDVLASRWSPSDLIKETNPIIFGDTSPGAWYLKEVAALYEKGIISGYDAQPGLFGPDNTITRAEFCKMVVEGMNYKYTDTYHIDGSYDAMNFNDVNFTDWFYNDVMVLAEANVVNGYDNGTFGPNDLVTRAQATKIVANGFELNDASWSDTPWSDFGSGDDLFEEALSLYAYNVMSGYPNGTFSPNANLTRAEAAAIIDRAINVTTTRAIPN